MSLAALRAVVSTCSSFFPSYGGGNAYGEIMSNRHKPGSLLKDIKTKKQRHCVPGMKKRRK